MALLHVLYERDYGIHVRGNERRKAEKQARTLRDYERSVRVIKQLDEQRQE